MHCTLTAGLQIVTDSTEIVHRTVRVTAQEVTAGAERIVLSLPDRMQRVARMLDRAASPRGWHCIAP